MKSALTIVSGRPEPRVRSAAVSLEAFFAAVRPQESAGTGLCRGVWLVVYRVLPTVIVTAMRPGRWRAGTWFVLVAANRALVWRQASTIYLDDLNRAFTEFHGDGWIQDFNEIFARWPANGSLDLITTARSRHQALAIAVTGLTRSRPDVASNQRSVTTTSAALPRDAGFHFLLRLLAARRHRGEYSRFWVRGPLVRARRMDEEFALLASGHDSPSRTK
jgi:hypothetical protein